MMDSLARSYAQARLNGSTDARLLMKLNRWRPW